MFGCVYVIHVYTYVSINLNAFVLYANLMRFMCFYVDLVLMLLSIYRAAACVVCALLLRFVLVLCR